MCKYCKQNPKLRWYVGVKEGYTANVFKSDTPVTRESHGDKYLFAFGPYATKKKAIEVAMYQGYPIEYMSNPERAWHAKQQSVYDLLRKQADDEYDKRLYEGKEEAHRDSVDDEDRRKFGRKNPPYPAVKIYDRIEEIRATKGKKSLWPHTKFKHKFTSKDAVIYGLKDGSLMVKSKSGKRLWRNFAGYKKGIDYP